MAEPKAEAALDQALDGSGLELAPQAVRSRLCDLWNAADSPLRVQIEEAMRTRAEKRHEEVTGRLDRRRQADAERARKIYEAFRVNLRDSLAAMCRAEEEDAAQLFSDDQQRQRRRDIQAMQRRLDELDDEEAREVQAIQERYADVKPHTTAAAVVFALTPVDVASWGAG